MNRSQRGVALLTVLLIMSLALLLTASLLRGHRLLLHSTSQQLEYLLLREATLAGETLALAQLREVPLGADSRVFLAQSWARDDLRLQLQDVEVKVLIEDLGGRLNLSSLLDNAGPGTESTARWVRLMADLQLPAPALAGLVEPLRDVSQLRLLERMTDAALSRTEPHVAVLPAHAGLNINTASTHQLRALGLPAAVAEGLVLQRPSSGFASLAEFIAHPLLDGVAAERLLGREGLALNSRWFRVYSDARLADRRLRLISDVQLPARAGPGLLVVQRRLAAPLEDG